MGIVLMTMVGACLKQPEYSIVPEITLKDLYFKAGNLSQGRPDSLVIKFDFKDGDGDLGVGASDSIYLDSYNPWFYYYNVNTFQVNPYIYIDNLPAGYKWVNYASRNIPQLSSQINFPPINCVNWQTINDNNGIVTDTLYITQNDNAYNIILRLYTQAGGDYVEFDPATYFSFTSCAPNLFKGTFRDLSTDRGRNSPIEGTFEYRFPSAAWNLIFSGKTLKLELYIRDRANHVSNTIERKDFTLASIRR
jgi:hypothetical protein